MPTIAEKRATFHKLHASGCFVIPNPWDIGTTRYLQHLGFKALATTSAGFAFARGLPDAAVSRDDMLAHIAELVAATDLPVNADFEGGYADAPEGVAESVRLCVETGVAGLSIEDSTGDKDKPLYDLDLAVARMKAARAAIDKAGGDDLGNMRKHVIARHRRVGDAARECKTRAGRSERLEAQVLQVARRADVPWVGNDEASGRVQLAKRGALFGDGGHETLSDCKVDMSFRSEPTGPDCLGPSAV